MKKIYLALCFLSLLSLNLFAQSLVLITKEGTTLPQNSTIYQPSTGEDIEIVTYLDVKNSASKPINVILKKTIFKLMDSTSTTMCWAGNCYPEWVTVSPPKTMEGGEVNPEFSGHYMWMGTQKSFTSGESQIQWVFYDEANPSDSASLMVYYSSYGAGIAGPNDAKGTIAALYPNPAKSQVTVSYVYSSGSKGSIIIRDLLGSAMKTIDLNAPGKVIIPVSDLADGIYFCTLLVDGKLSHSRKLVVKH